jgi:hypothetical protein
MAFDSDCSAVKDQLKALAQSVLGLRARVGIPLQPLSNWNEMDANVMLAYRHLEDATMRIDKAIQAYNGGPAA